MRILAKARAPLGIQNLMKGVYTSATALGKSGAAFLLLYVVSAGVLQGCPLPGSLYALVADPFLRYLMENIDKQTWALLEHARTTSAHR